MPEEEVIYGADNDNQELLKNLKIMTYNIHAANPPSKSGVCDLAAIARVINGANPDVVMLQEVDKNTGRNDYFGNQAKELGELTKMNSLFFPAISYKKGYYGVAVLSRYPLYSSELHRLPKEKGEEQRVLGTAWADLPGED
ncbi:MAG: endonuclease/exonuclease/phosphatase family protein, partial [Alphaproteobacteria bacterium]